MERLTQQNSTYYEKAIKQLQEYENTGLTPQEVELYVKCQGKLIDKEWLKLRKENAELKSRLEKSVELPCKVGDKVYIIGKCGDFPPRIDGSLYDFDGSHGDATGYYCPYEDECPHISDNCESVKNKLTIFEDFVREIHIQDCSIIEEPVLWVECINHSIGFDDEDFGRTVFLTKEKAEQALKGCADDE